LLGAGRNDDALAAFESALAADGSLVDVRRRVDVLRLRNLQELIAAGRAAAAAGRRADARLAYTRAIAASPDSAFLYREIGLLERSDGDADAALAHFRRAVELDPGDGQSFVQIGELLEARGEFAGAEAAYRRADEIDPGAGIAARVAAAAERARDARLPAEFRAIPAAPRLTRGGLAALIGVRLDPVIRRAPERQVVMTDVGGHWAAPWIGLVARAGVLEAFENHTFQPEAPVRRADLAGAVQQLVVLLSQERVDLRARLAERPRIADMDPGHLSYPAAAVAVATGVLPLLDGGQFQANRVVTGAEAVEAIARVQSLSTTSR
jgi:tetratricopeptide (TPR) repeat protein